jgi:hypothetical protein
VRQKLISLTAILQRLREKAVALQRLQSLKSLLFFRGIACLAKITCALSLQNILGQGRQSPAAPD